MRLVILVACMVGVLGSWPAGWVKSDDEPLSLVLEEFMYHEAIHRIMFPNRESIMLPESFTLRDRELLLPWKKFTADEFLKKALPIIREALESGISVHPNGHLLTEVLATFDGEDGQEVREGYCLSFYNTLQEVPATEWTTASEPWY